MRSSMVAAGLGALLLAATASADVTLSMTTEGTGAIGAALAGESTTYIKGARMRVDTLAGGRRRSTIFDIDAQQVIELDHGRKAATVHATDELQRVLAGLTEAGGVTASFTATGETRQVAGRTCDEHLVEVAAPMSLDPAVPMTVAVAGPACVVADAPGAAAYAAFFTRAAEEGFIVAGGVAGAGRNPGYARSMTEIYRQIAELGVPYRVEMTLTVSGDGLGALMSRVGAMSFTTTVLGVTEEPLDEELFAVPPDYTIDTH